MTLIPRGNGRKYGTYLKFQKFRKFESVFLPVPEVQSGHVIYQNDRQETSFKMSYVSNKSDDLVRSYA